MGKGSKAAKRQAEALERAKAKQKKQWILAACAVALIALVIIGAVWLGTRGDDADTAAPGADQYTLKNAENPVATIQMKDGGWIIAELYPDVAPNSVGNFIALANDGYYDNLIFHRVISGFMIQGGDPTGTGSGGPGYAIQGEFALNGVENNLAHTRGVLSMARSSAYDSAGSQFFIMHADAPHLDGSYAAFGEVVYGMETVDQIAEVSVNASKRPLADQEIASIRVDTKGQEYSFTKIGG